MTTHIEPGRRRLRRAAVWPVLVGMVVLGGACSSDADDDTASDTAAEETAAAAGGAAGEPARGTGSVQLVAAQLGRHVVRTATIAVEVDDVTDAAADAVRYAEAVGGFQASGQLDLDGDDGDRGAEVVLRVPAEQFGATLAALGQLGRVTAQQIDSEDVTGQAVDLEARVAAARTSVERVRTFLDRTGDVAQLAAVERELLTRESELEVLLGQQAALRDRVDLATVTARFTQAVDGDDDLAGGLPGPGRALRNGWSALAGAARVLATGVSFAAPFLPVAAVAAAVARFVQRRSRAGRLAPSTGS